MDPLDILRRLATGLSLFPSPKQDPAADAMTEADWQAQAKLMQRYRPPAIPSLGLVPTEYGKGKLYEAPTQGITPQNYPGSFLPPMSGVPAAPWNTTNDPRRLLEPQTGTAAGTGGKPIGPLGPSDLMSLLAESSRMQPVVNDNAGQPNILTPEQQYQQLLDNAIRLFGLGIAPQINPVQPPAPANSQGLRLIAAETPQPLGPEWNGGATNDPWIAGQFLNALKNTLTPQPLEPEWQGGRTNDPWIGGRWLNNTVGTTTPRVR